MQLPHELTLRAPQVRTCTFCYPNCIEMVCQQDPTHLAAATYTSSTVLNALVSLASASATLSVVLG